MRKNQLENQFNPDPMWRFLIAIVGFKNAVNLYLPFLGAGIRVKTYSESQSQIEVELKMNRLTKGYMGTHFGGSLYSMVDPFYVYLLTQKLGRQYMVWDKRAEIDYLKQDKSIVSAKIEITENDLELIKDQVGIQKKIDYSFYLDLHDKNKNVIARVKKIVYIRRLIPISKNKIPSPNM